MVTTQSLAPEMDLVPELLAEGVAEGEPEPAAEGDMDSELLRVPEGVSVAVGDSEEL